MGRAEALERLSGRHGPVRCGSSTAAAPARPTRPSASRSARRGRCPTWPPRRATWGWPAPTSPATWRCTATSTPRWRTWRGWTWRCRWASGCACCASSAGSGCCGRRLGRTRRCGCAAGATPRPATSGRSPTTTTCPTGSTAGCSGRPWRTPARSTRRRRHAWSRPSSPSTTWSPASSRCGRACGCSTSAAAGAAWSCTRPGSTACGRWG